MELRSVRQGLGRHTSYDELFALADGGGRRPGFVYEVVDGIPDYGRVTVGGNNVAVTEVEVRETGEEVVEVMIAYAGRAMTEMVGRRRKI
ncbi:hypothetical protein A3K55_00370 [Candidatus Shapirobacteria bacterium RBG_13_44_7]|uniref:Uncharacterized protein n=1 Tax=Candidatus Shapirobacteria bacterium RBG_13_44_7 TaxID=1802149 RepID=A0A1F7SGS6_9BACT|nr:MAG: hypothetical protein A3K55_00370 [Candidatus Shapirobacteria bacterium RBG_13_44_7]